MAPPPGGSSLSEGLSGGLSGDLFDAAFGADTARWPLPAATDDEQLWLRAVAAGGQGRYASAHADLDALLRARPGGPLASLAHSTRGSFWRQLGWHVRAHTHDGRALSLAGTDPQARSDALVGLAADALGVGRFAASARLLERAADLDTAVARLPIRHAWVSAELAMATGAGDTAIGHAQRARTLAAATDSTRHRIKSDVVAAAALCSAGQIDAARTLADAALAAARQGGLVPLCWALASLLTGIGSATLPDRDLDDLRTTAAEQVIRGGGEWSNR